MSFTRLTPFLLSATLALANPPHASNSPSPSRENAKPFHCPERVQKIGLALDSMTKKDSPWPTVPSNQLRLGMVKSWGKTKELYLFGYSDRELSAAGIAFDRCELPKSVARVVHPEQVLGLEGMEAKPNLSEVHILAPDDWTGEIDWGFKKPTLCKQTRLPLLCMSYDSDEALPAGHNKEIYKNSEFLAAALIHENFHAFQMRRFRKFLIWAGDKDPKELDACRANPKWMANIQHELEDWKTLYYGSQPPKVREIQITVKRILERRMSSHSDAKTIACWKWLEKGESVEGTPTFFSVELARKAGLKEIADPIFMYENKDLSLRNENLFDQAKGLYYLTGSLLLRAMQETSPHSSWTEDIEKGHLVGDVARKIFLEVPLPDRDK